MVAMWKTRSRTTAERWQMSSQTHAQLTPRKRLARGLAYSAVGPVDVTRGVVGLSVHSAESTAANLRSRYRAGQLKRQLAAAQEAASGLPEALAQASRPKRRSRRPWVLAGVAVVALAGGAAAFSIIRRSSQPEPSPRPPSVEVAPRP